MSHADLLLKLKNSLKENKISQQMAANACGYSRVSINRFLQGKVDIPLRCAVILFDRVGLDLVTMSREE